MMYCLGYTIFMFLRFIRVVGCTQFNCYMIFHFMNIPKCTYFSVIEYLFPMFFSHQQGFNEHSYSCLLQYVRVSLNIFLRRGLQRIFIFNFTRCAQIALQNGYANQENFYDSTFSLMLGTVRLLIFFSSFLCV